MATRALVALSCLVFAQGIMVESQANATERKAGVCDCMSWADVYYSGKTLCGRANELYFLSKRGFSAAYAATEPISGLPHKVCYDFFKNYMTPSCLNVDLYPFDDDAKDDTHVYELGTDDMKDKMWCYVSNECDNLNGGQYGTNQQGFAQGAWHNLQSTNYLSWKICKPGDSDMLKYWPVPEVVKAAEFSDVSVSRLIRLAYPVVPISGPEAYYFMEALDSAYNHTLHEFNLPALVAEVPPIGDHWGTKAMEAHAMLRDIVQSEQATVLDSPGHGDNYHVVAGRAFYEVKRIDLGNMAYLGGHFFKEFEVNCVKGCSPAKERKNAVDLTTM